jgi:hypothetical protein
VEPAAVISELAKQSIRVKLDHIRPTVVPTDDLLKSIDHQLDLIRLNQIRNGP